MEFELTKEMVEEMKVNCPCCGAPSSTKLGGAERFYVEYICGTMAIVSGETGHVVKTIACQHGIWEEMDINSPFLDFINKVKELNS